MYENITNYPSDEEAKKLILEVGRRMYDKGFVASNDGNISVKVSDSTLWATPTNVSKGFMTEDMLIKMDLDGNVIEGTWKPSSEIRMHLGVYNEEPSIHAVCHAHPVCGTAFAIRGRDLDERILPEGVMQLGVVPCAPFAMLGTDEVPKSVLPYVHDYNAVLMGNHGVLTWGSNLMQAYMRMETLEHYAKIVILSKYVMKDYREFTDEELDGLIAIRESLGIHRGGRPS